MTIVQCGLSYLDLFEWHFEAEGLVVVRVEGVLLDCRLLFLQSLPILHQVDFHIRIFRNRENTHKIKTLVSTDFLCLVLCQNIIRSHQTTSKFEQFSGSSLQTFIFVYLIT